MVSFEFRALDTPRQRGFILRWIVAEGWRAAPWTSAQDFP